MIDECLGMDVHTVLHIERTNLRIPLGPPWWYDMISEHPYRSLLQEELAYRQRQIAQQDNSSKK